MPHHPKKRFGQNFLRDQTVLQNIIACIQPQTDQHVLEIGPGQAALTHLLVDKVKRLDVVEIDFDLIPDLQNLATRHPALKVHQADVLKFDLRQLTNQEYSLRVVGNLPYNISTPLLFHLLEYKNLLRDIHVMLQDEVVERITATPGHHAYGRLSVMLQYHCQCEKLLDVPPTAFHPMPQVNSAVVRLIPYAQLPLQAHDYSRFAAVVQAAFAERRKMIRNTLKSFLSAEDFVALNLDPQLRAENLSVADFVRISNYLSSRKSRSDYPGSRLL